AAADGTEVVLVNARRASGGRDRSATARRSDAAPLQRLEKRRVEAARLRVRDVDQTCCGGERHCRRERSNTDEWPARKRWHETSRGLDGNCIIVRFSWAPIRRPIYASRLMRFGASCRRCAPRAATPSGAWA